MDVTNVEKRLPHNTVFSLPNPRLFNHTGEQTSLTRVSPNGCWVSIRDTRAGPLTKTLYKPQENKKEKTPSLQPGPSVGRYLDNGINSVKVTRPKELM